MNKKPKKIFITGGHLTPAIAVIDEIVKRRIPWELVFIGRTYAIEGSRVVSEEKQIIESKGIRFVPLTTGRLQRTFSVHTISSLIKIPLGFLGAWVLFIKEKPDAVISFGGYIALPVVVAAYFFRVPVLTHEQTRVVGLANYLIAGLAQKICISFKDMQHPFPAKKTIYTGLPVRGEILAPPSRPDFPYPSPKYPVLYITGGMTGSVSLNNLLFPFIAQLLKRYTVIHQTGKISWETALGIRHTLPKILAARYIIADYFHVHDVSWALSSSRIVICRAGANTVMELAILGKKAVLVPLPWSGGDEQFENARWLKKLGLGYIVAQNTVSSVTIREAIRRLLTEPVHEDAIKKAQIRKDGASAVVNEVIGLFI